MRNELIGSALWSRSNPIFSFYPVGIQCTVWCRAYAWCVAIADQVPSTSTDHLRFTICDQINIPNCHQSVGHQTVDRVACMRSI